MGDLKKESCHLANTLCTRDYIKRDYSLAYWFKNNPNPCSEISINEWNYFYLQLYFSFFFPLYWSQKKTWLSTQEENTVVGFVCLFFIIFGTIFFDSNFNNIDSLFMYKPNSIYHYGERFDSNFVALRKWKLSVDKCHSL